MNPASKKLLLRTQENKHLSDINVSEIITVRPSFGSIKHWNVEDESSFLPITAIVKSND